jgi:hypothetical protein
MKNEQNLDFLKEESPLKTLDNDRLSLLTDIKNELVSLLKKEVNEVDKACITEFIDAEFSCININIATLEAVVDDYKKRAEKLSRELIPTILNECGISSLTLSDGQKLTVVDEVKPSLAKERSAAAYQDMIRDEIERGRTREEAEANINEMWKRQVTISDIDNKKLSVLIDNAIPYNQEMSIHYQTLTKYCKTMLAEGRTISPEIKVYTYQETKIK